VGQSVKVAAVEADLADFRPGFFDELQIIHVPVFRPVGDQARELELAQDGLDAKGVTASLRNLQTQLDRLVGEIQAEKRPDKIRISKR